MKESGLDVIQLEKKNSSFFCNLQYLYLLVDNSWQMLVAMTANKSTSIQIVQYKYKFMTTILFI